MESKPRVTRASVKLAGALAVSRHLTVEAMRPDLSPEQKALVQNLHRSVRAEVDLRRKAKDHEDQQRRNAVGLG